MLFLLAFALRASDAPAIISSSVVGMALSGASSVPMLRANADALRIAPLSEEVMARLGALGQDAEEYWAARRALAWN